MSQLKKIIPFSLKDAPSLIESVLPVQKLSVDVYKERMAGSGQTLTALGSYWKGRKPLILNRACILGCLLPATNDHKKDLEIFQMLMAMDDISLSKRNGLVAPKDILSKLDIEKPWSYFDTIPPEAKHTMPSRGPFNIDNVGQTIRFIWREDISLDQKHKLSALLLPKTSYKEISSKVLRAEEVNVDLHSHIWDEVNDHLGTTALTLSDLTEQLGVMRFGHRPKVADTFSGSGQIPFEAARLGCNVYASDLNPIACMLTWAALKIVGGSIEYRDKERLSQSLIVKNIRKELDQLQIESDGNGWRGKFYLYCLEVRCPTSGWRVPLIPSFVISKTRKTIISLLPDAKNKRYDIEVLNGVSDELLKQSEKGTYQEQSLVHHVLGELHSNKLSTIRGDHTEVIDGKKVNKNKLRHWDIHDVIFRDDDVYSERLYAIQWIKEDARGRSITEYRTVNERDLEREKKVIEYVQSNLLDWQSLGYVSDMKIEKGDETERLSRERGWTYWHHLFSPRQILLLGLINKYSFAFNKPALCYAMDYSSRLCVWDKSRDGGSHVFYNQALNTPINFCCRGSERVLPFLTQDYTSLPLPSGLKIQIENKDVTSLDIASDIFITDPPYGDAVKYEEILEFFISWLRKNPPKEFADWIWDSRRPMAIKGEDHDFKLSMVAAYKRMTECMPENGIQVVMFTHQSGTIWADMANIVWASGLHVTAAWYVVTETDSVLRDGQYVKGTILLVLRKRLQNLDAARDELAYELADEVKMQVDLLTGLNIDAKDLNRDENLFEDADLQMAGYAAALRVLTRYKTIDGVDMPHESLRPRVKGQITMVDELIEFAVNIANEYLVPEGMDTSIWEKSTGIERLYLKMLDMESKGIFTLSNYQNFAKAFKVRDDGEIMNEAKANKASLKSAKQLGKKGMNATDEFGPSILRSVLYAIHLLEENKTKPEDVLHQLRDLVPDYYRERNRISSLAEYISKKTSTLRPEESSNAIVLRDLVRREKV